MTDEQFGQLFQVLKDIKSSIESLKGKEDAKNKYDLSDIYSQIYDVQMAVESVESAVKNKN